MVRCGGLGYRIDAGKPMGQRISEMTHLKSGKPIDPGTDYVVAGWGSVSRERRRPAGVGRGRAARFRTQDRADCAEYQHQDRRDLNPSWPGLSRPARSGEHGATLSGMPGTRPGMTEGEPAMSRLNLSVAIGDYDRNRPLIDGAVRSTASIRSS